MHWHYYYWNSKFSGEFLSTFFITFLFNNNRQLDLDSEMVKERHVILDKIQFALGARRYVALIRKFQLLRANN